MSVRVRLRIFSGLRNPEWVIEHSQQEARVRRWFATAENNAGTMPVPPPEAAFPPVTGFRGFDVTFDGLTRRVYRNAIVSAAAFNDTPGSIDDILFETNADMLIRDFHFTPAMMKSEAMHRIEGLPGTCDTEEAQLGSADYRPSSWKPDPFCDNTCYGYAADVKTSAVVTPDNSLRQSWSKSELRQALGEDGAGAAITAVPSAPPSDPDGHYIVAVLHPFDGSRGDFHFLRLDRSGCWSHKVSTDPVTQVDDQSKKITNLCTARFRSRFVFVGFFAVGEELRERLRERGQE